MCSSWPTKKKRNQIHPMLAEIFPTSMKRGRVYMSLFFFFSSLFFKKPPKGLKTCTQLSSSWRPTFLVFGSDEPQAAFSFWWWRANQSSSTPRRIWDPRFPRRSTSFCTRSFRQRASEALASEWTTYCGEKLNRVYGRNRKLADAGLASDKGRPLHLKLWRWIAGKQASSPCTWRV